MKQSKHTPGLCVACIVSATKGRKGAETLYLHRKAMARAAREEAYRSCGLVKVRGSLGGVYWE